eukprot:GDKJ01031812.1.p1 GENE.GDKJ01031812.1~~GDKJ01031812.1.p1  ORF type:complete len:677 (-),score=140.14 GDKJ01031812.1:137-2167(-)
MIQSDIKNNSLPQVNPLPRCVRNELLSPASCHTIPLYLRRIEEEILAKHINPLPAAWREQYPRFQKYFVFNTDLSDSDPLKSAMGVIRDSDSLPLAPSGSSAPRGTTCLFPVSVFLEALKLQASYYINGKLYHYEPLVLAKRDSLIRAYNAIAPRIRDLRAQRTKHCPKQLIVSFMIAWAEYEEVWVVAKEAHSVESLQPLSEAIHSLLPLRLSQAKELELPWPRLKHQMLITLKALDCFLRTISTLTAYAASTLEAEPHHDPRLLVLAEAVLTAAKCRSGEIQSTDSIPQPFAAVSTRLRSPSFEGSPRISISPMSSGSPSPFNSPVRAFSAHVTGGMGSRAGSPDNNRVAVASGAKSNFDRVLETLNASTTAGRTIGASVINYDSILALSPDHRKTSSFASPVRCPSTSNLAARNPSDIPANQIAAFNKAVANDPVRIFEQKVKEFNDLKKKIAHHNGDFSKEENLAEAVFASAALHVSKKKLPPPPPPRPSPNVIRLGDPLPFSPSVSPRKPDVSSVVNGSLVASPQGSTLLTTLSPLSPDSKQGVFLGPDSPSMADLRQFGVGKCFPLHQDELKAIENDYSDIGERVTYIALLRFDKTRISQLADDAKAVQRSKRLVKAFAVLRQYLEQVADELEEIDPDMDSQTRLIQVLVEFERAYKRMAICYLEPDNLV